MEVVEHRPRSSTADASAPLQAKLPASPIARVRIRARDRVKVRVRQRLGVSWCASFTADETPSRDLRACMQCTCMHRHAMHVRTPDETLRLTSIGSD